MQSSNGAFAGCGSDTEVEQRALRRLVRFQATIGPLRVCQTPQVRVAMGPDALAFAMLVTLGITVGAIIVATWRLHALERQQRSLRSEARSAIERVQGIDGDGI
ncbi:hypothetical protein G5B46_20125 [Caulobacter sp. 602-2]|uniref:Uncharacterized protein n=1 Tax=Caulobacter sp. 602-2 TaxID=2710887 RepID=A0A6G4R360_9CAUL|nr:hypothetical protein [Caulobacter sp. 602-2]NGM51925.1 hypothetical protein [Caulobacter sp. 602-2]